MRADKSRYPVSCCLSFPSTASETHSYTQRCRRRRDYCSGRSLHEKNCWSDLLNHLKQALSNQSIHDFIIVEYNSEIGGRMKHTTFGTDANGDPLTVELGANWVFSSSLACRINVLTDTDPGPWNSWWPAESHLDSCMSCGSSGIAYSVHVLRLRFSPHCRFADDRTGPEIPRQEHIFKLQLHRYIRPDRRSRLCRLDR